MGQRRLCNQNKGKTEVGSHYNLGTKLKKNRNYFLKFLDAKMDEFK
jgi:outer membrane receptor for Fe3+-dicitrate